MDIICSKSCVLGLWNESTVFSVVLKTYKIRTLLFAGVNINQCVLGTLLDAYYRGWDCIMIEDCCGTKTPAGQDVLILDVLVSELFIDLYESNLQRRRGLTAL